MVCPRQYHDRNYSLSCAGDTSDTSLVFELMQFTAYLTPHPLPVDKDLADVLEDQGETNTKLCMVGLAF